MEHPSAIVFDWDNTLVDNWPTIHDALNITLAAMGQAPWDYAETRARLRASMRDSFPLMFGDRWEAARDIFYKRFEERHLETLEVMPGAHDLLKALAASPTYLCIVSNKTGPYLRSEAEKLGWSGYFGRIVGAQDAPIDKPARDPVDMALAGSGVAAGPSVWFVGDTAIDMACAHGAGCVPVLIGSKTRHSEGDDYSQCPPTYHLEDLTELATLLREIGNGGHAIATN